MHKHKQHKQLGFTIIELLIVIVIIAVLATLTIVAYSGIQARAQTGVIETDLNNASKQLDVYKFGTSSNETYPADLASTNIKANPGTTLQYIYTSADNSYCLAATTGGISYKITSSDTTPVAGTCGAALPAGYETAPIAGSANTSFGGYSPIEPSSCPSVGGSWIKVPGNTLYGLPDGFCVQKYAASNVSGVATSQAAGPRWTAITQPVAATDASAVTPGSHLLSEAEWMTIAANAAAQPQNWSGGSVGNGTLPIGSATATYGGVVVTLSNGQTIAFDTGASSYYAAYEWTCYTGANANSCGLAAQYQPTPANAYYTDQFNLFSGYGSFTTNGSGYYYGDPRYANSTLGAYINSSRNNGLGYLRSSYASGSSTVYTFIRGFWTGVNSSGLFTLYMYTNQSYAHAQYGFRVAF